MNYCFSSACSVLQQSLILRLAVASLCGACGSIPAGHAEQTAFNPARHGKGELRYINNVPVAIFAGTPQEIGEQHAVLLANPGSELLKFPRNFLADSGLELLWPLAVQAGKTLLLKSPARHQEELKAISETSGLDGDALAVANTLLELRRLGCSTLIVEPSRSATGGPLFGRNFDFPSLGMLDRFSLVTIYRVDGQHAFASVGFPGLVGVLSGMNDAGLSVATLDVYHSADGSPRFDPTGVPLAFVFRQILEECTTVAEAEALLQQCKATTCANLAVCDQQQGVVFEITPKQVVRRNAQQGLLPCTNHFRAEGLSLQEKCWRYDLLQTAREKQLLGIEDVQQHLHQANQKELTLQTMIFEPRTLMLHLALGRPPVSGNEMRQIELSPLFSEAGENAVQKP